jgi:hypothetical protein
MAFVPVCKDIQQHGFIFRMMIGDSNEITTSFSEKLKENTITWEIFVEMRRIIELPEYNDFFVKYPVNLQVNNIFY